MSKRRKKNDRKLFFDTPLFLPLRKKIVKKKKLFFRCNKKKRKENRNSIGEEEIDQNEGIARSLVAYRKVNVPLSNCN